MKHGFKLFNAKVVRGMKGSAAQDVSKVGPSDNQHYGDYISKEVLPSLISSNTLTGMPRLIVLRDETDLPPITEHNVEGIPGDPRVRFTSVSVDGYHVLFKLIYGKVGQYQTAAAVAPEDDADIDEAAVSREYRCCLLLPETGARGVLAVESINGATPAHLIPRWLKRGSHEVAIKTEPKGPVYGLSATGVVDLERLRQMLSRDNQARIHLEKKTVSGSGRRRTKKLVLEEYIRTDAERENVISYAQSVLGFGDESTGNGLVELVELVDENVGDVGFDEGYIVFQSETDGTKKIGPNHLDQVFVYPTSAAADNDDDEWLHEVKRTVAGLATTLEVDLDLT
jgi:hypothetical protein